MFIRFVQTGGAEIAINAEHVRYVRAIDEWTTAVVLGVKGDDEFALSVDEPLFEVLRLVDPDGFRSPLAAVAAR
jgi:hypothetical protein